MTTELLPSLQTEPQETACASPDDGGGLAVETKTKIGVMVYTPVRALFRNYDADGGKATLNFSPEHMRFLAELAELSQDPECPYEFWTAPLEGGRTWARCRGVTNFRKLRRQYPNLKWIYWADDDVEQTGAGLIRLIEHRQPVVAAMYTTKGENPHWVANFLHEVELQPNGLLQVLEAGLGGLLTHYEVYELVEKRFPTLYYTDRDTGEKHFGFFQEIVIEKVPYSEDYFFCWLLRNTGIGIFVDTNQKLYHRSNDGTKWPVEWPPIPIDEKEKGETP